MKQAAYFGKNPKKIGLKLWTVMAGSYLTAIMLPLEALRAPMGLLPAKRQVKTEKIQQDHNGNISEGHHATAGLRMMRAKEP